MPKIGDEMRSKSNTLRRWLPCSKCGKERWVNIVRGKAERQLCLACIPRAHCRENHYRWNGGETTFRGYVYIYSPSHPMCNQRKYVKRARLVLEEKLGRYLLPNCIPHHINKITNDDGPTNLIELTRGQHSTLHNKQRWAKVHGYVKEVEHD